MASQITSYSTISSTGCSVKQHRKYQSSTILALCEGNQSVPVGFPSQRLLMWWAFPCHDAIMFWRVWDTPERYLQKDGLGFLQCVGVVHYFRVQNQTKLLTALNQITSVTFADVTWISVLCTEQNSLPDHALSCDVRLPGYTDSCALPTMHWEWHKMDAMLETTFPKQNYLMKTVVFWFKCH